MSTEVASVHNRMRQLLERQPYAVGTFITFTDSNVVELAGLAGFDFVVIECEHGSVGLETLRNHLRGARARNLGALVRVPVGDKGFIQRVLDIGADGVLLPHISSPSAAQEAVHAVRYPPIGHRGMYPQAAAAEFGAHNLTGVRELMDVLNHNTVLAVMIEERSAIDQIEGIAAIKGIDLIVVGPSDLSASLGVAGEPNSQELATAIQRVFAVCREAGMRFGTPVEHPAFRQTAVQLRESGAWFLASGSDATFMLAGWRSLAKRLREDQ
jgi:4-hydroxy-2-oxoheptanedioate aldolase